MRLWGMLAVLVGALGSSACMGLVGEAPPLQVPEGDAGSSERDAGQVPGDDAGVPVFDAGTADDGGAADASMPLDAGSVVDAGAVPVADDAGAAGDAGTPVFLLVGKQGRRAISCDDGRTWRNDVSFDDALPQALRFRCFSGNFALPDGGSNNTDCDHNGWSSTALAFVGDGFVHTLGWGAPGTVWRSADGVSWSLVHSGVNVQEVMVGPSRLVLATRSTRRSSDRGRSWAMGPELMLQSGSNDIWNVRGGAYGGGTYVVSAQDGMNTDWQVSRDEGTTWQRPQLVGGGRVDACGSARPAYGNGVFVSASWNGQRIVFCRSVDQGLTWSLVLGPMDYPESRMLFTGQGFAIWSNGKVHRSTDGSTWTTTNTVTRSPGGTMSGGPNIGAVAIGPTGTFVAVRGGWDVWYDRQRFYRSSDGVTWDELPETAYEKGHPVTMIVSGVVPAGVCP